MIPGDIGATLGIGASGTWRPAPPGVGGAPGTYATSLPFRLAVATGREPGEVAAELAATLGPVTWVKGASVTRGGTSHSRTSPSSTRSRRSTEGGAGSRATTLTSHDANRASRAP